jgi:hypothetical protein
LIWTVKHWSCRVRRKKTFKLPEGATIVKQSENISVKEIENGFVLRKTYDIQYTLEDFQ